jgi:hypothetical protein
MADTIPRRIRIDLMTPGELACRDALIAVEAVGGHPLLTDAVNLISAAQSKVADYIDRDDPSQQRFVGYPRSVPRALSREQYTLLSDKLDLWRTMSVSGSMEMRDYHRRAAEALAVLLEFKAKEPAPAEGAQLRPRAELLPMLDALVADGMGSNTPWVSLVSEAAERIRADGQ